jgi:hypothetical protein
MLLLFTILKFVHILLAIIAVGFNASYGIWLSRARQHPASAGILLRGVKLLDDRFANPAYGLLLLTGVAMVLTGPFSFSMFWVSAAMGLWVIAVLVGFGLYTPEYQAVARRGTMIGMANMVPILLILIMMVFKPTL